MKFSRRNLINNIFYTIKPLIPRRLQILIRRDIVQKQRDQSKAVWPIDVEAKKKPSNWVGWPDGKQFAFVLMHDVDTQVGHDNCLKLMQIEKELGIWSTFYFVPERYTISEETITTLKQNGFGVGVHGLTHDGKLFKNKKIFNHRAHRINQYLAKWETTGFSSPSMHHNLGWMHKLNIEYGTSTFDTDPFEPQPFGVKTIFPFVVQGKNGHQYVELPYTLVQDHTLFVLMQEKDSSIWNKKIDWIAENGGMALLNSHPDYMHFEETPCPFGKYPVKLYTQFLQSIKSTYSNKYINGLSKSIAQILLKCK